MIFYHKFSLKFVCSRPITDNLSALNESFLVLSYQERTCFVNIRKTNFQDNEFYLKRKIYRELRYYIELYSSLISCYISEFIYNFSCRFLVLYSDRGMSSWIMTSFPLPEQRREGVASLLSHHQLHKDGGIIFKTLIFCE